MARSHASRGLPVTLVAALVIAGCGADTKAPPSPTPFAPAASTVTPTPTSTPTALLTPTPKATSSLQPAVWRQVPRQASVEDAVFLDVVWTGARFLAAASDVRSRGMVLDSADGVHWHRQPSLGPVGESMSLAAGAAGVVAVSLVDGHLTSWLSADGLAWTAKRDAFRSPTGARSQGDVADVVANGDGWLAVGSHDPSCFGACAPDRALVWTSTNGTDWTEIPHRKALDGGWMNAVAHGANGFVAAGVWADAGAAIWISPDGLVWTLVSGDPMFVGPAGTDYGTGATGVAVRGTGSAVVGYASLADDSMVVLTWWSPTGGPWSRSETTWVSDGRASVATTPDGFLGTWSGGCLGGIWASDGPTWQCDAPDPQLTGFLPVAAGSSETVEVVVGTLDVAPDSDPPVPALGTVWYRTQP